jgi:hypothetical protein
LHYNLGMAFLCTGCVKVQQLKNAIVSLGGLPGDCPVCGAQGTAQLRCTHPTFRAMFRALIRYHYSEAEYNTGLGGEPLESVLSRENPITDFHDEFDLEAYEAALAELLQDGYESGETKVSLFGGFGPDQEERQFIALDRNEDERLRELKRASFTRNHYQLHDEARALLEPVVGRLARTVAAGSVFYRARIGYVKSGFARAGSFEGRHYTPFEGTALGAPPPPFAAAGRMNRGGVSYLYVATTPETAIAEIRPHPGHYCSVGGFLAQQPLRVCDLSLLDVTDFASDELLREFLLLRSIDTVLAIPVIPENRAEYHFPQLLADVFRILGYDGIGYRSAVGSGANFVFFDPGAFTYEAGSARVTKIEWLSYATHALPTMTGNDGDYWTRADGHLL